MRKKCFITRMLSGIIFASLFTACPQKQSETLEKIPENITVTVKPAGVNVRLKESGKNFFISLSGVKWKDIKHKAESLLDFETGFELDKYTFENLSAEINDEEIFSENKTVFAFACMLKPGIKKSETEEMVNLKIKGDITYEIGFIDPVNGYVKERSISKSFAIAKTEVTFELWEKVYNWATKEKTGRKYSFVNAGFCGGRRNPDKKFVENPEDGKAQPVVKISPRDAVVWCNAYSEMSGLVPVYYEAVPDLKDLNAEQIAAHILRDSSKGPDIDSAKELTAVQAKIENGKNGYRLPAPDEWELAALLSREKENTIDKYSVSVNGETWYFTKSDSASGAKLNYKNTGECKRVAWFKSNSDSKTHPTKQLAPNDLGIYDMSGNAAEWCFGFNGDGHYLFRGGDWFNGASSLQLGNFMFFMPYFADVNLGFRTAKTLD